MALPKRPRDAAQLARHAVLVGAGEIENDKAQVLDELERQHAEPAGRALSGKARAASMTATERAESARKAALARWHPSAP